MLSPFVLSIHACFIRNILCLDQINEEIDSFSSSNKRSKKTLMQGVNKVFFPLFSITELIEQAETNRQG